jgi:hypothetical protein
MQAASKITIAYRGSCKSIERTAFAVIPAKAEIQNSLFFKDTGFPITTSGMTNQNFCKRLHLHQVCRKKKALRNKTLSQPL